MAWTGNFKTQIIDLTGSFSDEAAMQQWIKDGCHEVARKLAEKDSPAVLMDFTDSANSSVNNINITGIRDIIFVFRNGVPAEAGTPLYKHKYEDSNSLYFATAESPIFYIEGRTLNVYPAPSVSAVATYRYLPEYTITDWDTGTSAIANYPVQWYRYSMIYAALQVLHRKMVDLTTDAPVISATAPTAPAAPVLASGSSSVVTIDALPASPTYNNSIASSEFTQLATLIDIEEDSELAGSKLSEIQAIMSNEMNEFNEAVKIYEETIKRAQQQAQMNQEAVFQDYSQELGRYQQLINQYSAEVQSEVEAYNKKTKDYEWMSATYSRLRSEFESAFALTPGETAEQTNVQR